MFPNQEWSEKTVVYHIYVRSFKDSNGDGIGDIQGIISQLSYLRGEKDSLGIDAVWLSPIYTSPQKDFGYDVADYLSIDPIFGSMDDFDNLLKKAHRLGIKVMMDFVPNHTSSAHWWFQQSLLGKDNPKRNYYIWADPGTDGAVPNNWLSVFGGSAWEYDEMTKQYYYHTFDKDQPDLNWRNEEVVDAMLDVLRFWLDKGVDGFRVDAIEWLFKDKDLRDEPGNPLPVTEGSDPYHTLIHTYTYALPEVNPLIKRFADTIAEYGDKFLVTEVWQPAQEIVKLYTAVGKKMFAPFNFGLIIQPWKASIHKAYIDHYDGLVTPFYFPTWVLGNHDKPRLSTRIGSSQLKNAAILLLTLRGIPFIYYGEEIGMENGEIKSEFVRDSFEKRSPGLKLGRDGERTPMLWNTEKFAGFSTSGSWLPIGKDYQQNNVEIQTNDPSSLLNLYKRLLAFRQNNKCLCLGKYTSFDSGNENVFAYIRTYQSENLLVVLNYSSQTQQLSLPFKEGQILISTNLKWEGEKIGFDPVSLGADEGMIISL